MPEHILPQDIERRSFEIIGEELAGKVLVINGAQKVEDLPDERVQERIIHLIKRCIHTTADFEYAESMWISEGAVAVFDHLTDEKATIVTDTNMALAGINKKKAESFGCRAVCFMADEEVAAEASRRQVTRAMVSLEKAMQLTGPVIYVVGNAPTALLAICDRYDKKERIPDLVIGVPVGFVNVEAAKDLILERDIHYIGNKGRKGGSNVAAAIMNALLYTKEKE